MYIYFGYYFLTILVVLYLFTKLSYRLNLVDQPNRRKIHKKPTAFTGGIAICFCFLIFLQLTNIFDKSLASILAFGFLVSLIGLLDDKYSLNVGGKLSLQIIPIVYLIIFENLSLTSIGDYNYFNLELGNFKIPFTLLCVLFLTNSFNYFDGLDGTLSFALFSVLLILYFLIPNEIIHVYLITIFMPLVLFLFFNFSLFKLPKLFLGDSGSLLLGFVISFLLIYLSNEKYVHPILLGWSVVIFVYEFLSINIIRIKNNQNIFKAGNDHLHHILFYKTKSLFLTNFFITLSNIIIFLIGYLSFHLLNETASILFFILLFIIYFYWRNSYLK